MKKVFTWKAMNSNNDYVEISIASKSYLKAEEQAVLFANKTNLKIIEYLGWE